MSRCRQLVDVGRRRFMQGGAATAASAATVAVAGGGATTARARALVDYPSNRLANLADLEVDVPVDIDYPDASSPGVLLKLGRPVEGGVGPEGDVVAFSILCPHKGYGLFYSADDRSLNCPGHYSRFDPEKGGQQIWGQATQNLPQFTLRVDDQGDIYAEGVDELIYGRLSNVL